MIYHDFGYDDISKLPSTVYMFFVELLGAKPIHPAFPLFVRETYPMEELYLVTVTPDKKYRLWCLNALALDGHLMLTRLRELGRSYGFYRAEGDVIHLNYMDKLVTAKIGVPSVFEFKARIKPLTEFSEK